MFVYTLGDYDVGHKEHGEALSAEDMVSAATNFANEWCGDADQQISIDYKNNRIILGDLCDEDTGCFSQKTNFLRNGSYIIGEFEEVD